MSDFTTNLQLPYLMPAQAQKHVTVNEALRRMDALVQMRVQSRTTTAQPGSPGDGQMWILPSGKTGSDWGGFTVGRIAYYRDGAWEEITPRPGWFAFVADLAELNVYTTSGWVSPLDASGALLESECASAASVKAVNQGLATSSAPLFARLSLGAASVYGEKLYVQQPASGAATLRLVNTHAAPGSAVQDMFVSAAGGSGWQFLRAYSSDGVDTEFLLRGDGNGFADGAWTGGGADYAEYLEWADGNPDEEDRRGVCVVIAEDGKIRPAHAGDAAEAVIGAVSANPTIVGDAAWNRWDGKFLRDAFGAYLLEDCQLLRWIEVGEDGAPVERCYPVDGLPAGVAPPADAEPVTANRRVLNPAFDPQADYMPRAERREWAAIGLMGKLRLRAGQKTGARWIKLRDLADGVEEWLVR